MLAFIIFEIPETYFLPNNVPLKIGDIHINKKYLKIKLFLVSTLAIVAIISIPLISLPGNKFLKHALEWDYFLLNNFLFIDFFYVEK